MKKIFAANWKLHKTPSEAREFVTEFSKNSQKFTGEVVIFPSAIALESVSIALRDSSVKFGCQNCYVKSQGAFTGENSADVVKSLGGEYILIGHSERRTLFGEADELVAEKVTYVQSLGLTPMLCIGETLAQREGHQTKSVLTHQLKVALKNADSKKPLVVAYEPVWAIGTGKVASAEQVAETHTDVANILKELGFVGTPILYGGSVKADNAAQLISQPHVSGFLVGGAALEADSFAKIASV